MSELRTKHVGELKQFIAENIGAISVAGEYYWLGAFYSGADDEGSMDSVELFRDGQMPSEGDEHSGLGVRVIDAIEDDHIADKLERLVSAVLPYGFGDGLGGGGVIAVDLATGKLFHQSFAFTQDREYGPQETY